MAKRYFLLLIIGVVSGMTIHAQEVWSLEKCINTALANSLLVERNQISLKSAEIDLTQARHSRYPSLSAGSNVGWNFGRTIDPTRNEFITETFFNNGFNINSSVALYNGGRINKTISQSLTNNKAALWDLEQVKRDIALNVATLYLNILFAKENLAIAENQLSLTNNQADQLKKLIAVGNRPDNEMLDIDAQAATNEQNIVEARNSLSINILNLKQLIRLDPGYNLDIVSPDQVTVDTDPDMVTFDEVYEKALGSQASVTAGEFRLKSAEIGEKIAKSDMYPSIGAGGSIRSNYSNKGFQVTGYNQQIFEQKVIINNQEVTVGFPQEVPIIEKSPYFSQFGDNLSYAVGLSLNMPIYSNYSIRAGIQRAKLNRELASNNLTQIRENLKITVGQALFDARAAKSRYQATEKSRLAQLRLYENAIKRFEIGAVNSFELTRIKTQLETSELNSLVARYNYLFRSKVLDFYLGKPIRLSN